MNPEESAPPLISPALDAQQTIEANRELQVRFADAVSTLQAQWVEVRPALKSIFDDVKALGTVWLARQKQWAEYIELLQAGMQAGQHWMETLADVWSDVLPTLRKHLAEVKPRIRNIVESAVHVGELGWPVSRRMTLPQMLTISATSTRAEADAIMLAFYSDQDDFNRLEYEILNVRSLQEFRIPLTQCFTAYRRGEYAVVIPFLMAVLERGIKNLADPAHFFSTKIERIVRTRYENSDPNGFDAPFVMSLLSFVSWLYEQYNGNSSGERIVRNGIQHGTQPPPNEQIEVLRLLHALAAVTALGGEAKSPAV